MFTDFKTRELFLPHIRAGMQVVKGYLQIHAIFETWKRRGAYLQTSSAYGFIRKKLLRASKANPFLCVIQV